MISKLLKAFIGVTFVGIIAIFIVFTNFGSNRSPLQVNVSIYPEIIRYLKFLNGTTKSTTQSPINKNVVVIKAEKQTDSDGTKNSEQTRLTITNTTLDKILNNTTTTTTSSVSIENPTHKQVAELPLCSKKGENLVGPLFIDQTIPKDMKELEQTLSVSNGGTVEKGGWWSPTKCKPRKKVALIIPFRKRNEQLRVFLRHMHTILQRQELFYRIFVVDQLEDDPFNRAGLFNVGFVEAMKLHKFDCFVFTDVDLLPEDDRNYYGCPTSPRHMSVGVDKFDYKLPYAAIFGGVGSFLREDFEKINGFSNLFWGWGGEDDDLYGRIVAAGFKLTRPSLVIGRYTMIRIHHVQSSKANPDRGKLLKDSSSRMKVDGLNTLKYKLVKLDEDPLVTFVRIELKRSMYA